MSFNALITFSSIWLTVFVETELSNLLPVILL